MRKSLVLALIVGAGLIAGLSACTAEASVNESNRPVIADVPDAGADDANNGICVDGTAKIVASDTKTKFTLGDCESVGISGDSADVTLGKVGTLTVEGDNNKATVASVANVGFGGNGNTVTYGGAAPQTIDHGQKNTVTAR